MLLPVGLVYDPAGNVALDPDTEVQQAIRHPFETFPPHRVGARSGADVQARGLLFPARIHIGKRKGELAWGPLRHRRVLRTLHNSRYAGAFALASTAPPRPTRARPPCGWWEQ